MKKNYFIKGTKVAIIAVTAACMMIGCEKKENNRTVNETPAVTESAETTAGTENNSDTPSDTCYENSQLGFKAELGADYMPKIVFTEGTEEHSDEFDANSRAIQLDANLNNTSYPLATIYVYDRVFDEAELENINPMMVYLGTAGEDTYTILYAEVDDIEDTDTQNQYNDLMNHCIMQIKDHVTLSGIQQ